MSIKLFVTDLDGTLLLTGQEVSNKNKQAVHDMINVGVTFTIATGRMYQSTLPIAKSLGVDVPLITYNGALIKSTSGEIIYSACIDDEIVTKIADFCKQNNWHVQLYQDDNLYYPKYNELAEMYENAVKVKGKAIDWQGICNLNQNVTKMLVIANDKSETDKRIDMLKNKFGDKIDAFKSNATYIEITRQGVSKASGIKILADKLNISISEVLAIGDSYNDVPMLKTAGVSVAMGNASDEIKNFCTHVTGNCIDDGLAQAVYNYVIN